MGYTELETMKSLIKSSKYPGASQEAHPPASVRDTRGAVQSLGQEDPLEKGMATHSSVLPWEIPWTEEPGELYSMGSQRVRHNLIKNNS